MSNPTSHPRGPEDEPGGQADALDSAHEAELINEVIRVQERRREGGVEPELAGQSEDPEPGA
jgi:hypothetical protein